MTKTRIRVYAAVAGILVGWAIYQPIFHGLEDASGWWQVAIAFAGLPIFFYELHQIRQAIAQKPVISVGLASVQDLPFSKIGELDPPPDETSISQGYPHFFLVIRNYGNVMAKFVKIHLEYKEYSPTGPSNRLASIVIEAYEWLGDKRFSFKKENNVDFIFIGGADWSIYPSDFEVFSFYITTALVKQKEPVEIRERPGVGDYHFGCTVWADGLNAPISTDLLVKVTELQP